ncbi:hypothetical protein VNO78_26953 [Psophocarpus tetragonolobus]|uniref:ABC transporter B family member 2-like n=1 Tax=Psophocarpus tetragonolobus TaxID=3891 RepID=A0AAN9S2K1_PSOTE
MSVPGAFSGLSAGEKKGPPATVAERKVPILKLFSFADFYDCVLMAVGSIGACVHGASVPVFFVFFGKIINVIGLAYLFPKEASHEVAKYALDFVYLSIAILFSSWTEVACWMHTGERQAAKMRMAYLRSMLNQDISLFDTEASTGEVISSITSDIVVVQEALSEKVGNFMHYISRFIAGFTIGFVRVWQISLVTLAIVPLIALAGGLYAYVTIGLIGKVRKAYVRAGEIAEEVIGNVRTVQAFAGEERALRSYKSALTNTYRNGKKAGLAKGLGLGSMHCVLFLSWALLVWFTSIVVHKNIANGGDAFTTMLNVVISGLSLGQAAPDISAFIRAKAAAYPIFEMIDRDTMSKASSENGQKLSKLEGHIQFMDVCFSYPSRPDVVIFNNFCLEIPPGKILALVGGSGSGKSTVISLIERFYEPLSGQILLDGNNIKELDLKWLRQQIGLVNQEPALFATSIRENILYGNDHATLEEINQAVMLSDARSFINNLPDGLDTQGQPSADPYLGGSSRNLGGSSRHLGWSSRRLGDSSSHGASFRGSFHSDKESTSRAFGDGAESFESSRHVSAKSLYSMIGPDWLYGVFGTLGALIAGAQMPLFALGISHALVSYYMDWDTTRHEVKKVALLFCGAAVLTITAHAIEHLSFGIMGERLTLRAREKMFSAILKSEIAWFDDMNNTSSMLSSRLETDATLLRTVIVDRSTILLQNVGLVVASFIIAFMLNWRITLVVLATYPLIISGHISEKLFMQGFGGNLSKAYLKANMLAGEAVSNIRTVAAFCAEKKVLDLYANELVEPSKRSFNRGQIAGIFYGISQFFIFSSYGLALWYGSVLMEKELSSFKSIMKSFMVLIVTALAMGETLALAPDLLKGNQMVASIFEVMDRKTGILGDVGEELKTVDGKIELKGIHFSYPSRPDVVIFNDLNLTVPAGKNIALVGHSGCGKSSVISLILRFYDPTSGKVMIDGKDIKKLNLKSLRKHIGLVQQEPALFATSIYENILYGKEEATEAEVIEAAKHANAHSFISALPEGYSTKVGERGVQLSGGQKQRVAIARAVLKNPEVLLLDEATSALDLESERVVQQALDKLMQNRTTFIVAHRLSTITNADQIVVLEDGKIIERGTHARLVQNTDGAYYKLISLQQQQQQHVQEHID